MCGLGDLIYFSSRKVSCSRGGGIATNRIDLYNKMKDLIPLYEGFLTYGDMSVREIEAMAVGLRETTDEAMCGQSPALIKYLVNDLGAAGVPIITPAGGLGAHIDAGGFLQHIPQTEYPAGALAAAFHIISGARGMARNDLQCARRAWQRYRCRCGIALPRPATAGFHPFPSNVCGEPDEVALCKSRTGGRLEIHRRTRRAALLSGPAGSRFRLAGKADGKVPQRLRRKLVTQPEAVFKHQVFRHSPDGAGHRWLGPCSGAK